MADHDAPAHAAVTQDDPASANTFQHEFTDVDGVRMHYVTGGSGTPVVLIHGWPQTWYGWWPIMPELAKHHTVYAVDLPGLGDSTGTPTGYDKATLARYVHTLIADRLGVRDARVIGQLRRRGGLPVRQPVPGRRIELTPTADSGTVIHWHGTYDTNWLMGWIMPRYLQRFMQGMAEGLARCAEECTPAP
ncbi:alpha/beta fold hydrolase [Streptomyces sp. NPDC048290]|uniref:alpha/beta fold hydrolase n=1 Tax=Streptomyces sp. NPDC048290 TaxID=3155811 RepID=UPI003423D018